VYDIKKNKWSQIDSLRVARSGCALSAFKNNYIFAFGGRVDQKAIVDTVECYDISKNVWQEVQGPGIDKSQWVPGYMSLAYQITDNEIVIFGGKSALT
jgi:N-acetylneuraminic acid mutarotase